MTSVSAYPQKSFITKKMAKKTVTINEIIKDEHEHARHVRAERFHGKKKPRPKATHGDTVVYSDGQGPFAAPPPEINTARMMEALRASGVGHSTAGAAAQREYEERVRRAKELRPKRPLTAAQLASEAACNAVIAEQRSIVFAKPPDLVETGDIGRGNSDTRSPSDEQVLSLTFDTLMIGGFIVSSSCGRQRAGTWQPPQHGSSAPPEAEAISYSSTGQGLWCSTAVERTAVLRDQRSGSSGLSIQKDWSQCKSSRMEAAEVTCACPYCSGKVGKQVSYVPSQESLEAAAKAGTLMKRPPNYRPGARTEKEKAPHLPRVYLAQAVIDVKPSGPPHMKGHGSHSTSSSHSRMRRKSRPAPRVHADSSQVMREQRPNQVRNIRPARHSKLVWIFAHDWLGGNVAKVEIDLAGVCALKLVGRTLTASVTNPAATRRFVGYEYKGQFSQWQQESPGVDFSEGECTSASEHTLVARRKADMTAFCERLAACSVKFTKLLAAKSSDGSSGNHQNASKSTGITVSFAVDDNSSIAIDSTVGSRSASLAEALQAGGSDDIVYASKPLVSPPREDRDWGMKAWNERPSGKASCPTESDPRSIGLRSRSANDRSSTGLEKGGRSRRARARPRMRKQAWSPSAIVTDGWENESRAESSNVGVSAQDSTVSMSRSEQRVYGSDASVAELLS